MTEETATAEAEAAPVDVAEATPETTQAAGQDSGVGESSEQSADDAQDQSESEQAETEIPAYVPSLKAPEGANVTDEARLASIGESVVDLEGQIAGASGDRGKIRETIDTFMNAQIAIEAERAAADAQSMNDTVEGWRADSMKNPEFGGSKWPETEDKLAQVMTRFGSDELGDLMTSSGIGNHPTVIQFMLKVQDSIGEADPTGGADAPSSGSRSHAQRIYG